MHHTLGQFIDALHFRCHLLSVICNQYCHLQLDTKSIQVAASYDYYQSYGRIKDHQLEAEGVHEGESQVAEM